MRRDGTWQLAGAIAALGLLVVLTQIGSLRFELIDHDEATFMVMAQSVLRGHLPYVEAFDNKPPGLFLALAGTMWAFGQSVASTRLLGDLCILGSALCLLGVTRKYAPLWLATSFAAIFVSAHLPKIAQYTSAEVVANLPMAAALLLLLRFRRYGVAIFAAGALLSLATLVRTNLGIVALAVEILLVVAAWRPEVLGVKRWSFVALGFGGLLPVTALTTAYASQGQLPALWAGAVAAPLAYTSSGQGLAAVLSGFVQYLWVLMLASPGSALMIIGMVVATATVAIRWKALAGAHDGDVLIATVVLGATIVSMLVGGAFYPHYLLQLFPVGIVLMSMAATIAPSRWKRAAALLSLVFALGSAVLAAPDTIAAMDQTKRIYGFERLARELSQSMRSSDQVWTVEHVMLLFYLDQPPISPLAALPSMIFNKPVTQTLVDAGVVSDHELERIIALKPKFLVLRTGEMPWEVRDFVEADYEPFIERGEVTVLRRRRAAGVR